MISFIIPAHNESSEIRQCLESVFKAAAGAAAPFEVVVVNDASTDNTRELASAAGARVIDVELRQISAVRNAGAKAARGDTLFFVDADTQVSEPVVRAALLALARGAVGGGAWVHFAERVPWVARASLWAFGIFYMRLAGWAAGCFVFARRADFEAVGGFDEHLYAGEEIVLSRALKRRGSFIVLRESVSTSARKMRLYSFWRIIPFLILFLRYGPSLLRQRKGLEWWYEGRRE